jgi:hypothetical protein
MMHKKFGHKIYKFADSSGSKISAKAVAEAFRKRGYNARVTKTASLTHGTRYRVWKKEKEE